MDEIENEIKKNLPTLDDVTLKRVLNHLIELGVSNSSELILVEEADLKDVLKTIQARLLIRSWRRNSTETKENETLKEPSCSTPQSKPVISPVKIMTIKEPDNLDWAYNFEVQWASMPSEILKPLQENQRLPPGLRRRFIQIITNAIRNISLRPGRKALALIARKIVKTYTPSLVDMIGDQVVGEGHSSLLRQMQVRFDNLNRISPFNILKRTLKENSCGDNVKAIRISDTYGCVNWQLPQLPINETEVTQESKRQVMLSLSQLKTVDLKELRTLLKDTYFSQRKDINCKKNILSLKEEWPLLFRKEGLFCHFKLLMEFDISEKLNNTLESKGLRIFSYLKKFPIKKQEKKMRDILDTSNTVEDDPDLFTLINLLAAYFNEDPKELFTVVDIDMTTNQVEDLDLPTTPHLICYGTDANTANYFTVMIDGKIVLDNLTSFTEGFALTFLSYYVFNIHYPKEASVTLEFVQRCFLGINPNRGSKVNQDVKKRESVNFKILKLLNRISESEFIDS